MYKEKTMMFLYAETPIHPGAGSGTGFIDLPVQRERFTGLPIFQASGIKGAMREDFETQAPGLESQPPNLPNPILDAFGPDTARAAEHAGALGVSEAEVLLFPIRSLYGVFAYLTCPLVLQRFKRDLELVGHTPTPWPATIPSPTEDTVFVISTQDRSGTIIARGPDVNNLKAVFDEYAFSARPSPETRQIAEFIRDHCLPTTAEYNTWRTQFPSRFAIVPDDVFRDFTRLGAEVLTRNRIDDTTGTVEEGALWTEEHLPSETFLYSILLAADPMTDTSKRTKALADARAVLNFVKAGLTLSGLTIPGLNNRRLQIGGDQTLGRGIVMARFLS